MTSPVSTGNRHGASWDGPQDASNPQNWPPAKKWTTTVIVSALTLVTPISSSMIAPATTQLSTDFNLSALATELAISIFVLGYAIGPLFLAPLSEVFGRVWILNVSNGFFWIWTLGCALSQNESQIIAFRFLSGLGGGAPLAIAGGVLTDIWPVEQRGKILSIFVLGPLLGPVLGPIAGGWISQYASWRWIFWSILCVDIIVLLLSIGFLPETYAPRILKIKASRRKNDRTQNPAHESNAIERSLAVVIRGALSRPFLFLGTHPTIQFVAAYLAYLYGVLYLLITTFPILWTEKYHESVGVGGLNYLSLGIGLLLGALITTCTSNALYATLRTRNTDKSAPEYRLPLAFLGSLLVPVGIFWYGWSAQQHTYWIVPNLGVALFAVGNVLCSLSMQNYVVDAYEQYAASGIAAVIVTRSVAGFGFPLFAPAMYKALDYGWGNSVLGFTAVFIGIPAPYILWIFGERFRSKSEGLWLQHRQTDAAAQMPELSSDSQQVHDTSLAPSSPTPA